MSGGYMPVYQLLCQAGGKLAYDDQQAEFAISSLPQNTGIAGSVNGYHALDNVLADAAHAAASVVSALGLTSADTPAALRSEAQVNFARRSSRTLTARILSTSTKTFRYAISSMPRASAIATSSW